MVADGRVEYYELTPVPGITVQFYTRRGGVSRPPFESLDISSAVRDQDDCVEENARLVRHAAGLPAVVTLHQVHSSSVVVVAGAGLPPPATEGDALVTAQSDVGLGVRVADCLPVYLYSRDGRCAGIAHCGWRGTVAHVARRAAETMMKQFSVSASELAFCLGPSICADCYVVGDEVRRLFESPFPGSARFFAERRSDDGRPRYGLDLRAANRWLLNDAGLKEDGSLELCSLETPELLYSVRRDRTTGRNLALIAIRTQP
jgi:YfiH family protein